MDPEEVKPEETPVEEPTMPAPAEEEEEAAA